MNGPALQAELARLEDAYQVLLAKWSQCQERWQDGNAEAIDEQFMQPLGGVVRTAVPAIGQLNDELTRSIRVCSEPQEEGF